MKLEIGRCYHYKQIDKDKKFFEGIVNITKITSKNMRRGDVIKFIDNAAEWRTHDVVLYDEYAIKEFPKETYPEYYL